VCPFYNYFQPAAVLVELNAIDARAALRVAAELVIDQGFSSDALLASFLDVVRRGQVGASAKRALLAALSDARGSEFATATATLVAFAAALAKAEVPELPAQRMPASIDYVSLLGRERARTHAAKLRRRMR
jgi:hypothetical protein